MSLEVRLEQAVANAPSATKVLGNRASGKTTALIELGKFADVRDLRVIYVAATRVHASHFTRHVTPPMATAFRRSNITYAGGMKDFRGLDSSRTIVLVDDWDVVASISSREATVRFVSEIRPAAVFVASTDRHLPFGQLLFVEEKIDYSTYNAWTGGVWEVSS